MAGMQQVITAVCEHNSTPSGLRFGHPAQQFFLTDNFSQQVPSARFPRVTSRPLFYHAPIPSTARDRFANGPASDALMRNSETGSPRLNGTSCYQRAHTAFALGWLMLYF